MRRTFVATALFASLLASASFAHAQPTFGRPKGEHRPVPSGKPSESEDQPKSTPSEPAPAPTRVPPETDWREDDAPRLNPVPISAAAPGEIYCWKTEDGTRYAWSLPTSYQPGKAYNIVLMLPPARSDFRWCVSNFSRKGMGDSAGFCPDDILVWVDGTSGDPRRPNQRCYVVNEDAVVRFRDVVLEFSRVFPMKRVYLFGTGGPMGGGKGGGQQEDQDGVAPTASGGGAFATAFSSKFPALADGVLVASSGIVENTEGKSTVPIVFMHGAKDSVTPLRQSIQARDAFVARKHERVRLRVLRSYNDFPNPVRAAECLDYIDGVRSQEASEVFDDAMRLLTPKPGDEYGYSCPVWYAGAYELLLRLTSDQALPGTPKLEKIEPEIKAKAQALRERVEAEALTHAKAIRDLLQTDDLRSLPIDGGAWLGYLIAFRDDFRGVPATEELASELGYDLLAAEHAAKAQELLTAWHIDRGETFDADRYRSVLELLPECYLYEGLPVELGARMKAALRKADELELTQSDQDKCETVVLLERGMRDGLDTYEKRWRRWELEGK